jgi:hypothetical protein
MFVASKGVALGRDVIIAGISWMNRKSAHLKMVADRSAAGRACSSTDRSATGARAFGTKKKKVEAWCFICCAGSKYWP